MFLSKVLTGVYTKGKGDMVVPPLRNTSQKKVRFDSVVDNMGKPNMYIVFYDHRAYAEYLVQYRCDS